MNEVVETLVQINTWTKQHMDYPDMGWNHYAVFILVAAGVWWFLTKGWKDDWWW